ncbi:MAG: GNAT family N-acetyltransferase [Pseudomonadota bacterium]
MSYPKIKSNVIYLEMLEPPKASKDDTNDLKIELQEGLKAEDYLTLYKEVGRHYIWNYRPSMPIEDVQKLLDSSGTEVYYFSNGQEEIGFAEIDSNNPKEIEIVHFGLTQDNINKGLGKNLFANLLEILWGKKPDRIHLSTCGLDHPKAPKFYQAAGFKIYKEKDNVEFEDYRYSDFYELTDAPQIPLAREKENHA